MLEPRPTRRTSARPAAKPHRDRSGLFAWFVAIFGLIVALALVGYGLMRGGGDTHAAWLKLSEAMRKHNEPVYLAEMKPADVPANQNFFAAEVFDGLTENAPTSHLLQRAADPGNGLSVADLLSQAQQGGGASLEAIAVAMQRAGLVRTKTDYLLAGDRVRAGMRALGLDFAPLNEAADRTDARFPIDFNQPFPALPHLRYLEALGDWLAIRAIAQLSTGDAEDAANDLLLLARMADSLATEPFLPSQRTRRMLLGLFAGCVRVGINWDAWSGGQLAQFGETLSHAQLLNDFAWAVRGERAQLNSMVSIALSGKKPGASEELQAWFGPDLTKLDARGLRARQVAVNAAIQHFLDALTTQPLQPSALAPDKAGALPEIMKNRMQSLADDARIFAQVQTYLAQAETACALERHRLQHGNYPEKLTALMPDLSDALPADPLDSQPFDYIRKPDDGFVLKGMGWTEGEPWMWTRGR
ncbi:MAG: hypothetical protein ACREKL_09755 [Chthoniobacterales bacterium]